MFRVIFSIDDKIVADHFNDIEIAEIYSDIVGGYVQVRNPIHGWVDVIYE